MIAFIYSANSEDVTNDVDIIFDDNLMKTNDELSLSSTSTLYYEPFALVDDNGINNYGQAELQLTDEGLQIVAFPNDNEYEAVLINDDDSSSFGDVSSVYEDVIPSGGAIIALGFRGEGSDGYIFRQFENNGIIKHKVDTLFTLTDFEDMEDTEIDEQLSSQIIGMDGQDFQSCYSGYTPDDEDDIILGM